MSGFWSGVAAYTIWGLVPIDWKLLKHVPASQVLGHRIVWSLAVLVVETAILAPLAIVYLVVLHRAGEDAFLRTGATSDALMIGGGLVTTVPLLLFAAAVRSVPLSVMGILQYIGPTLQFLLGVFVYDEPFSRTQLIGFSIVWAALAIYAGDSLRALRLAVPVLPVVDEPA